MKQLLLKIIRKFGYNIVPLQARGHILKEEDYDFLRILKSQEVDLVLDIGANRGQFGTYLKSLKYDNTILSFEPLSKMHNILTDTSKKYNNWEVYEKACIGAEEGKTTINISNLVGNSSVLDIKDTKFNVPNSGYIDKEGVKQITLASLNEHPTVQKARNIFIKMDVQGYEHVILSKLNDTSYNIIGFYIELSLTPLYDGQQDYLHICGLLRSHGYEMVYVIPESVRQGRMIQFNGIFLKKTISYS